MKGVALLEGLLKVVQDSSTTHASQCKWCMNPDKVDWHNQLKTNQTITRCFFL